MLARSQWAMAVFCVRGGDGDEISVLLIPVSQRLTAGSNFIEPLAADQLRKPPAEALGRLAVGANLRRASAALREHVLNEYEASDLEQEIVDLAAEELGVVGIEDVGACHQAASSIGSSDSSRMDSAPAGRGAGRISVAAITAPASANAAST